MAVDTNQPVASPEYVGRLHKTAVGFARSFFGQRTLRLMRHDALRFRAQLRHNWRHELQPSSEYLHLGSGGRPVPGWLNVDLKASDYDIDFLRSLPWRAASFSAILSEHVIEHFELFDELLPLLARLKRALIPGGELWLSCPDMERICQAYLEGRAAELVDDRLTREPSYSTRSAPVQQIVNDLFHQYGEHKNLFDYEMLKWALETAGFTDVRKIDEAALLKRFQGFPARQDDLMTLYVTARTPSAGQQ